ncbi:hypothetical protein M011DRAFT_390837, partial [Sporormia fimetaria CBS 119925]
LTQILRTLITANHVLHYNEILDAYGHISVRNPHNDSTFLLSRNVAPALVCSPTDIVEYQVSDGEPVDPHAPPGFEERFLHSEIYKYYPAVNSVVHSHVAAVIPFSVSEVPLMAMGQSGGVMGAVAPVFDSAPFVAPDVPQTFLINTPALGAALAATFSSPLYSPAFAEAPFNTSIVTDPPIHNVVLLRGHGMAVQAPDIESAVFRSVWIRNNAQEQAATIKLAALARPDGQPSRGKCDHTHVQYLDAANAKGYVAIREGFWKPGWELWVREVEAAQRGKLYRNDL